LALLGSALHRSLRTPARVLRPEDFVISWAIEDSGRVLASAMRPVHHNADRGDWNPLELTTYEHLHFEAEDAEEEEVCDSNAGSVARYYGNSFVLTVHVFHKYLGCVAGPERSVFDAPEEGDCVFVSSTTLCGVCPDLCVLPCPIVERMGPEGTGRYSVGEWRIDIVDRGPHIEEVFWDQPFTFPKAALSEL
jgi:hypothetical protein